MGPARAHLEQAIALYDPQHHHARIFLYGHDSGVACLGYTALALWYLGYPDQGLQRSQDTLTLAQGLSHPYSLGHASTTAARLHQLRHDEQATQERAEALVLVDKTGERYYEAELYRLKGKGNSLFSLVSSV